MAYSDTAIAQFENVNALRSYPFTEDPVSRDGRTLPKDVVSDLRLMACGSQTSLAVQPGSASQARAIAKMVNLHMSQTMLSACFVVYGNTNSFPKSWLSVTVSMSDFVPYAPYRLEKLYGTEDAGGIVTFGNFEPPLHPETYIFDDAVVDKCCVAVLPSCGLRSFYDPRSDETLRGDVRIDFSAFVNARRVGSDYRGRKTGAYRLDLEEGVDEALAAKCDQASDTPCGATPITSINGIGPDGEGNIVLWFH